MASALATVSILEFPRLERFGSSQERKTVGFEYRAGRQMVGMEEQPLVLDVGCMSGSFGAK